MGALMGLSPQQIKILSGVVSAFSAVGSVTSKVYAVVMSNQQRAITAVSVLWVLFALL
jgi:hypothetical protein